MIVPWQTAMDMDWLKPGQVTRCDWDWMACAPDGGLVVLHGAGEDNPVTVAGDVVVYAIGQRGWKIVDGDWKRD